MHIVLALPIARHRSGFCRYSYEEKLRCLIDGYNFDVFESGFAACEGVRKLGSRRRRRARGYAQSPNSETRPYHKPVVLRRRASDLLGALAPSPALRAQREDFVPYVCCL